MQEWQERDKEYTPDTPAPAEPIPPVEETPVAAQEEPTPAVAEEAPAPTVEQEAPAPAAEDNGCTYHYANPAPQSRPVPPPVYTQTVEQPQNGWQVPPQGNWQPPKRKKSRHTGLLVGLSVVCVVSLLLSTVMAVKVLREDKNGGGVTTSTSTTGASVTKGTTNPNAPDLTIQTGDYESDGGLSTREMTSQNVDSTVLLTMYEYVEPNEYWSNGEAELTKISGATGIVWTADGYIITNAHCVYNEETGKVYSRLDVELYNGTVFEGARVIGYDTASDLAVIKVEATNLKPAVFGDSSKLRLGDRVIAIGNPGGLGFTVTDGIISSFNRDVYSDTGYGIKCIQTNVGINPGSSGGPLINSLGQVIGINSAKIIYNGYEGLGFTIPINEAKVVLDELVKNGKVTGRVSLGIYGGSVTKTGLEGFQISSFTEDSCFLNTEAQVGDIIAYVDEVRVVDYSALRAKLATYQVGDSVEIILWRYNSRRQEVETITVTVTLGEENR